MATRTYAVTRPQDATTAANIIGTEIQVAKQDIQERLMQGGHKFAGIVPPAPVTNEAADGKHCIGYELCAAHQDETGYCTLVWSYDGATPYLRQFGSTHATQPLELAALNSAKFVGINVTSGLDPGHLHTQGGVIGGKGGTVLATGYIIPSAFRWAKGAADGVQTPKTFGVLLSAPPTGNFTVEIRRHLAAAVTAGTLNVYTDAASDVLGTVTITVGKYYASAAAGAVTLADGDVIVFKVTALSGGPADPLIYMTLEG